MPYFVRDGGRSAWDILKSEPKRPTAPELKQLVHHLKWLRGQAGESNPLAGIPAVKINRFAAEARSLNVARMSELIPEKRHALAAALVFQQRARAFDDAGEMYIRMVGRADARAEEIPKQRQAEHAEEVSGLIRTLRDIVLAYASATRPVVCFDGRKATTASGVVPAVCRPNSRNFVKKYLPKVIERLYPDPAPTN